VFQQINDRGPSDGHDDLPRWSTGFGFYRYILRGRYSMTITNG